MQSLSNPPLFSTRQNTTFLHSGALDSTSALHRKAVLKSEITRKNRKMQKMCHIDWEKDTCLQYDSWDMQTRHYFIQPQLGNHVLSTKFFIILWMSANDHKIMSIDFEFTSKLWWVGEFANIESLNNKDSTSKLHFHVPTNLCYFFF